MPGLSTKQPDVILVIALAFCLLLPATGSTVLTRTGNRSSLRREKQRRIARALYLFLPQPKRETPVLNRTAKISLVNRLFVKWLSAT